MKVEPAETGPHVVENAVPLTAVGPAGEKKEKKRKREQAPSAEETHRKRVVLSLTKPSYLLGVGSTEPRPESRERLRRLLRRLLRAHNWPEACGVAARLLQATRKERCPASNRFKYTASMELLKHIGSNRKQASVVSNVYDLWMLRAGINFANKRSGCTDENSFAVRLESIVFLLLQGRVEAERQNARSLMQEHGYENRPELNLIVGMIFYQLWYSSIEEYLRWKVSDEALSCENSDMPASQMELNNSAAGCGKELEDLEDHGSNYTDVSEVSAQYDSDTSVRNDKEMPVCSRREFHEEKIADDLVHSIKVEYPDNHQSQGFYATPIDIEASVDGDGDDTHFIPDVYALENLEPWLLPLQTRSWVTVAVTTNDEYRFALKCLRDALYSTRGKSLAALLPLIQLLLIGREYKEALKEVETFSDTSSTAVTDRLRATLLELIDPSNEVLICTCYEDSLRNDPTCSQSLARLIVFHKDGVYSPESLLESIALHLEATFPERDTWREFATCFLKVSQSEEDRMSVCMQEVGTQKHHFSVRYNRVPGFFIQGVSGRTWKLRWRWWSRRHFSISMLELEITNGDHELLTYKAACATHIYGRECEYVMKVYSLLEKENNRSLFMFLQLHMHNSVGLHLHVKQRS